MVGLAGAHGVCHLFASPLTDWFAAVLVAERGVVYKGALSLTRLMFSLLACKVGNISLAWG